MAHLETDLRRDGEDAASPMAIQDGDHLLQELPFTPLHAPVLTLETYRPSARPAGSRSSLAHLYSAGFPDVLDRDGRPALVLDPADPVHYDPGREEADPLRGHLLVFQFLAFSRVLTAEADADWPESVHFTFQFYRFPPVTSQRLTLQQPGAHRGGGGGPPPAGHPLPCVLYPVHHHDTAVSPELWLWVLGEELWDMLVASVYCGLFGPRVVLLKCPPITLIGEPKGLLSVSGWWVGVVYPVLHCPSGPSRPRFTWRDATLLHPLTKPQVDEGPGVSCGGGCVPHGGGGCVPRGGGCVPRGGGGRTSRRDGKHISPVPGLLGRVPKPTENRAVPPD
ncbi:unnamed protein product [Boreogadus saida]